ncbi:MAG: hypothetical protein M3335_10040 [Actinomycetota bacterium]|nr:hypothetical protein [Actinomycetota bacterium]
MERWGKKLGAFLAIPALLALFAAAAYAIGDAALAPAPTPKEPGFIDTILGSRAVVAAIRLAIVSAAAFVVLSVVALAAKGQWLVRVGPVQVSERVSDLRAENQRLQKQLEDNRAIIDDLEGEVAECNCLLYREMQGRGGTE